MGTLARSWTIFKKSMTVIGREKSLLIFPVISGIAMIILVGMIICGGIVFLAATGAADGGNSAAPNGAQEALGLLAFFGVYLVTMLVTNLCGAAFYSEIFHALDGDSVSIARGFRFAFSRFKAILLWSLLASTVGVILQALQERAGLIGKILLKVIGVVWAVASCFAIPAIVMDSELNNPFEALKRSSQAICKTWGESLVGFVGIQSVTVAACLAMILAEIALLFLGFAAGGMWIVSVPLMIAVLAAFIMFCYVVGVAQKVYQAALYLYASGFPAELYTEDEISGAFKRK